MHGFTIIGIAAAVYLVFEWYGIRYMRAARHAASDLDNELSELLR